ncbi:MAG TPA: VWA domain-containing protein [Sulfurimonas sp.]|nr:VWA domain-containing protein [Sulfurimonas sp.]
MIGIDISDSMKAEDRYPNRLSFSKQKAIELIKAAPHNRIGVLAFAKHDYIVSPLSFDHSSVAFLLSKVNTKNITEKGTHLDSMLNSAISMLSHADTKNLLIFTDGGDKDDFSQEIELAKENGLRIFIIAVGTSKGSPVRQESGGFVKHNGNILISKLNENIKELSLETGGVYIESVLGEEDIMTMLKEIEDITEKSTLKKETIPQYTQLFYYPLALALFFLLLAFASVPLKWAKHLVVLGALVLGQQDIRAGILDFKKLDEAKEAYVKQEYKSAQSTYEDFAIDSAEATYNLANTMYKQENYERALKVYKSVKTEDKDLQARSLYNSANTQVKLKAYAEALKTYEEALEIKEDKQTRENYEAVKKFLEEKKKQEEEKKDKNKDKEDKDKQNQESKDKKDSGKDQQDKEKSENKKDKENKDKEKSKDKKEKQKSEKKEDKDKKEEASKKDKKDTSAKDKQAKENNSDKKENKQKSEKNETPLEKTEIQKAEEPNQTFNNKKMSELEAKKWINLIKKSQKGHLYKMQDIEHEEDSNEKPW